MSPLIRHTLLIILLACQGDPLNDLTIVSTDPSDSPLDGLTGDLLDRFNEGDVLFEDVFRESQGLGPTYVRHSCGSCHADDARGPGIVEKMIIVEDDGITAAADQSELPWGHSARPQFAGGAATGVTIPDDIDDLMVTTRVPPAVFGRGYLAAIDEDELLRLVSEQEARGDAITGKINRVTFQSEANPEQDYHDYGPDSEGLAGRFGLKAQFATLDDFTADAYQGDMSITSPMRPSELNNPDGLSDDFLEGLDIDLETVNVTADYVRLLEIPERTIPDGTGAELFEDIECSACHPATLRTVVDYPVDLLADLDAPIYSDLLLHDMGEEAGDAMVQFDASSTEWKTAPLIGLRFLRSYLHDGRATTVEEAILEHAGPGSEANEVIEEFEALNEEDRLDLIDFVTSL